MQTSFACVWQFACQDSYKISQCLGLQDYVMQELGTRHLQHSPPYLSVKVRLHCTDDAQQGRNNVASVAS